MLPSFQENPKQGYLKDTLHIFAFPKNKPNLSLYFDFVELQLDPSMLNHNNKPFKEHYRNAIE